MVDPGFQWKYAWITGGSVFFISSVMGTMLYAVLHHQAKLRALNPGTLTPDVATMVLVYGVAFGLIPAVAVAYFSVRLTHRICGPLYVLNGYIAELGQGRLPVTRRLRRADEFKPLHESFAAAIRNMRTARRRELTSLIEATGFVRALTGQVEPSQDDRVAALLDVLDSLSQSTAYALGERSSDTVEDPPSTRTESNASPQAVETLAEVHV